MKYKKLLLLGAGLLLLAASCNKTQPTTQVDTTPKVNSTQLRGENQQPDNASLTPAKDCGQIRDTTRAFSTNTASWSSTEISAANCINTSFVTCSRSTIDITGEGAAHIEIRGIEDQNCLIAMRSIDPLINQPRNAICKFPLDVIAGWNSDVKQANKEQFLFFGTAGLLLVFGGQPTDTRTGQKINVQCSET